MSVSEAATLVARLGPDGARDVVAARVRAMLDSMVSGMNAVLFGRRDARPVGLASGARS